MLTIALLIMNFLVTILGIFIFDYQIDNVINSPFVIILSILAGWLTMVVLLALYIEVAYIFIAKNKPKTSMLKHKIAKQMVSLPMHFMNMRSNVVGLENLPKDPGFSIYANHTSMFDIPLLMYKLYEYPVAFLQKDKLVNVFMFGKWTPALGCVTIDRSDDRKGAEAIINVIRNVKSGSSMVVFPEGTRSNEIGSLLDFKPGSFKVALKSKAPLVPMTIVKPKNYKDIKWPFKKRTTLIIHKPIPFEEFKSMKSSELAQHVKEIIGSSLNTIYK